MYIYNVTIKVTDQIADEWLRWMQEEHLNEVVATTMFDRYQFYELLEPKQQDEEGRTFVAQYFTDSESRYNQYLNEFAPSMRQKGFERFGDQFIAFRSLMRSVI